jgi:integrase
MSQVTPFVISEFTNPSGEIVFRLTGWLDGKRIRKNFPSRAEASAERQTLEIQQVQAESGLRTAITRLTDEQLHEAEAVFRRLADKPRPLSFYCDFALANYREPENQKPLIEAIDAYVKAKTHEFDQGHISRPQIYRITWDLKRLDAFFPKRSVAELSLPSIISFLEVGRPSMKTYNNRRGILSTFFKFAFQRGWIVENLILKVPHYRIRHKRGSAVTFSVEQSAKLMEHFEQVDGGRWIPYFALCLFAGIRPGVPDGEITKIRPADVNLDTGIISITCDASKVREPRRVTIQPNLAAWLRAYPLSNHPIVIGDFKKRREKFSEQFNLTHDVLRHTYISMHVAKFRSIGEAAIQAGNSESIIRKHYLDMKTPEEGARLLPCRPRVDTLAAGPGNGPPTLPEPGATAHPCL